MSNPTTTTASRTWTAEQIEATRELRKTMATSKFPQLRVALRAKLADKSMTTSDLAELIHHVANAMDAEARVKWAAEHAA